MDGQGLEGLSEIAGAEEKLGAYSARAAELEATVAAKVSQDLPSPPPPLPQRGPSVDGGADGQGRHVCSSECAQPCPHKDAAGGADESCVVC